MKTRVALALAATALTLSCGRPGEGASAVNLQPEPKTEAAALADGERPSAVPAATGKGLEYREEPSVGGVAQRGPTRPAKPRGLVAAKPEPVIERAAQEKKEEQPPGGWKQDGAIDAAVYDRAAGLPTEAQPPPAPSSKNGLAESDDLGEVDEPSDDAFDFDARRLEGGERRGSLARDQRTTKSHRADRRARRDRKDARPAKMRKKRARGERARGGDEIALDKSVIDGRGEDLASSIPHAREPDPLLHTAPERFLPRVFYFDNTYLGGNAAYLERLRRLDEALSEGERPYHLAHSNPQPFDPPTRAGLAVSARLDAPSFDRPRRAFLQIGLRGSPRHGWRRPPLDMILVLDGPAFDHAPDATRQVIIEALRQLGAGDRLGVVLAGAEPRELLGLRRVDRARGYLATRIDQLARPERGDAGDLQRAMLRAGQLLSAAAEDPSLVPGSQTLLVVTAGHDSARISGATGAAHALTTQGAVTSVLSLDGARERGDWWRVANAGYGNYHQADRATVKGAVSEELASLARVVARLVRVNIRLGKHARAVRVLGARVLDREEVRRVKAREVAMDKSLSRAMGISQDRGEDDDGMQTVIPYFYGDDSHVILIELWVDGPGPVAEVSVRYKDMVNLDNGVARASVRLDRRPRAASPETLLVQRNIEEFRLAEALERAAQRLTHRDGHGALSELNSAARLARATGAQDRELIAGFQGLVEAERWRYDEPTRLALAEALRLASERKVGEPESGHPAVAR